MKLDKEKILHDIQGEPTQEDIDYIVSLDEMATVGRNQREQLLIQVHPSESQAGNAPYFKVYDSESEQSASRIARIRFDMPIYEIHAKQYNRGKDYWWLNSKEKRKLITYLNAPNMYNKEFTNWQYAILSFNSERGINPDKTQENLLKNGQLKYPGFIPYDLPMPNYMLLPPDEKRNTQMKQEIERARAERKKEAAPKIKKKERK